MKRAPQFSLYGLWVNFHCSGRFSGRLKFARRQIGFLFLIMSLWAGFEMQAQTDWRAEALVQRLPDGQAYLEVQTSWISTSLTPQEPLTVTVMALQNGNVLCFEKDDILARPHVEDTVDLQHVHVRRLPVPSGNVVVEWRVEQLDRLLWLHNENVRVPIAGSPEFTDPILVQTHAPATSVSQPEMVHSGLDLIPEVGRRIPLDVASALFYTELHGLADIVGQDSLFLLVQGWARADGSWDPIATKYARLKAAPVIPIFESLPCSPTSPSVENAVLKLEARTRDGHVVVSRDVSLGARSLAEEKWVGNQEGASPLPSLASIRDRDTLARHLEDHLPVATTNEQNTIQNTLIPHGSVAEMQQYLTGFWLDRSSFSAPEAEARHVQYMERIAFVDEAFGDCKRGQGSLTEMGNIYWRFGKPNTVVQRHHETEYYPYEIWHYHKAGRFNNKRFLFYAPHVVGECFELLHSDMLGERQNEDWLSQLRSRENRLRVTESMENRLNPRDAFSREEPEDLFFNPR